MGVSLRQLSTSQPCTTFVVACHAAACAAPSSQLSSETKQIFIHLPYYDAIRVSYRLRIFSVPVSYICSRILDFQSLILVSGAGRAAGWRMRNIFLLPALCNNFSNSQASSAQSTAS